MVVKRDKVPFEDALNLTGFGKFNLLLFVLCSGVIIGMAFEIYSVSYLVPASACEFGTTSSQQGLVAGVPLIGIIATSHVWGYMADTRGRKKILSLSLTLGFISGSLATLSPNWIVLSVLKFMSSASVSGAFAISLTLLSECTPIAKRSTFVTLTTSVFISSTGFMAVLAIPILPLKFSYFVPYLNIHFNSWRVLNLIFCTPSLIGALGVMCAYESPKYLLSVGKEEQALKTLNEIFAINYGKSQDMYPVNSITFNEGSSIACKRFWTSIIVQTSPLLKPPLLKDTLLLAVLFFIVFVCINPFIVWLPFIVNSFMSSVDEGFGNLTLCKMMRISSINNTMIDHEPVNDCSMNNFAMTMVFAINIILSTLNIVMIGLMARVGRKMLFMGMQITSGISAIIINMNSVWILSAILFVVFLISVINFGVLTTYSVDIFPTHVKAMAVCLTLMVGRGSAVLGINLLKNLLENNCEAAFYIFGSVTIVGGLIGFLLPSDEQIAERRRIRNPQD